MQTDPPSLSELHDLPHLAALALAYRTVSRVAHLFNVGERQDLERRQVAITDALELARTVLHSGKSATADVAYPISRAALTLADDVISPTSASVARSAGMLASLCVRGNEERAFDLSIDLAIRAAVSAYATSQATGVGDSILGEATKTSVRLQFMRLIREDLMSLAYATLIPSTIEPAMPFAPLSEKVRRKLYYEERPRPQGGFSFVTMGKGGDTPIAAEGFEIEPGSASSETLKGTERGSPQSGQAQPSRMDALEITLTFDDDASDSEIASATAEVVQLADRLHRASGGHGLVLDTLRAEQPAHAEAT